MTAIIPVTRFTEIEDTLRNANEEFTRNLGMQACSFLLSRLVKSTDKDAEFNFISNTIKRIVEQSESGAVQVSAPNSEEDSVFDDEECQYLTVGEMYSKLTDWVETLSPSELYRLIAELRGQPLHNVPEEPEELEN